MAQSPAVEWLRSSAQSLIQDTAAWIGRVYNWIVSAHSGDVSFVSLVLTIVGFGITIYTVMTTRGAARAAEDAARGARARLATYDSIATISAAILAISEIRRLHIDSKWELLPDRYSTLRHSLIAIRAGQIHLTDDQSAALQSAIQQFGDLERQVDRAIINPAAVPDRVRLNRLVSRQADQLTELLTQLRVADGNANGD